MLKSILNATGIIQNLERVKSELEQEANVQISAAKTLSGHIAILSMWALGAGIGGLLAVILAICLIYAWLAPTYGPVTALTVLFLILALFSLFAVSRVRSKAAQIPHRPPIKFPRLLGSSDPIGAGEQSTVSSMNDTTHKMGYSTPISSPTADPLFNWLFDVAREAAPSGNTGNSQIDQLFTTLKPKAEEVASEAMTLAVDKLRYGDRKTMIAILGAATFVGWIASRHRKPISKS